MNDFDAWEKILAEWKKNERRTHLNQELYDLECGFFVHVARFAEKNNIPLPKNDQLFGMVEKIHAKMKEIDGEEQPKGNTDNLPTRKQNQI